jgi:glutathione synthase/RimK-type ligase-like ATP-grasp enzyme
MHQEQSRDQTPGTSLCLEEMQAPCVLALRALMDLTPPQVQALIDALHRGNDLARTYMQMFYVFLLFNQHEAAVDMQTRALRLQRVFRIQGTQKPLLRLLVVMGPGHMQDNTPIEFVLHGSAIQTEILYLLPEENVPAVLPVHDISFIAIGESDRNAALLEKLDAVMRYWPTPVINRPQFIPNGARDRCYQLLKNLPGVCMPATRRIQRGDALGMAFPITIRPVDTQGGEGLQRVDHAQALAAYYASHPANAYYAALHIDYQSADGYYRKMRIVLIDGAPYICHLAISAHWMVHYLSAGMGESPAKRLEEQRFMEGFAQDFARRFKEPLEAIARALQLDYVTIDCAEGPDGRLLVFEADSRGIIHAADPVHIYPYKPAVMQKAFDAFATLLFKRSGR